MRRFLGPVVTASSLTLALLLLILLPYTTAAVTQPQTLFRPMALPLTDCPADTAQQFDQDVDDTNIPTTRLLDRTTSATSYSGSLMVPPVFAGRQAWLILSITDENPDPGGGSTSTELHELFLTNGRSETIFLGVIDENTFTAPTELVFQIPQDALTAGNNDLELQLDEILNLDPNVQDTDQGDITIDSMRVCYGGYFVYKIPFVCGFTPVDLEATDDPSAGRFTDTPAIKQGDYATNVIIRNPDIELPTTVLNYSLYIEFAVDVTPLSEWTNFRAVNNSFGIGLGTLDPERSNYTSCDALDTFVRGKLSPSPGANDKVFWKGLLIIRQPIGDGTTQTKLPLDVEAVYTYESVVNKVRLQILKDPTGTIPRHLIGTDLEMIIAINPLNKTDLALLSFNNFQLMRVIRENIRNQFPAAADRATLRVIEVSLGVGSSQTVTRIEPIEAPLPTPL